MFKNLQQDENEIFYIGVKALIKNSLGQILVVHDTPRIKVDGRSETYWDIPGGRVQLDERALVNTLKREIEEELGITNLKVGKLFDCTISNHYSEFDEKRRVALCLVVYLCQIPDYTKIILSTEHDDFEWVSTPDAAIRLENKYSKEFTKKVASLHQ